MGEVIHRWANPDTKPVSLPKVIKCFPLFPVSYTENSSLLQHLIKNANTLPNMSQRRWKTKLLVISTGSLGWHHDDFCKGHLEVLILWSTWGLSQWREENWVVPQFKLHRYCTSSLAYQDLKAFAQIKLLGFVLFFTETRKPWVLNLHS